MSNAPSNSSGEHGLCGSNVIWNNQMSQQRPIQTNQLAPLQPMIEKTCTIYPQFLVLRFCYLQKLTGKLTWLWGWSSDRFWLRSCSIHAHLNLERPNFPEVLEFLLCQQCQYSTDLYIMFPSLLEKDNGDWLSWQTHVVRRDFTYPNSCMTHRFAVKVGMIISRWWRQAPRTPRSRSPTPVTPDERHGSDVCQSMTVYDNNTYSTYEYIWYCMNIFEMKEWNGIYFW